jgi:Icc-related predicted phosphoesterase
MRICHVSDLHGNFKRLNGVFDIVVSSGDLLPNRESYVSKGRRNFEESFQYNWIKDNIEKFKDLLDGKPFLFINGNHDFLHPDSIVDLLRQNDINAISLEDKIINFNGINFYGFPYIPYIHGGFNYEKMDKDMVKEIDKMIENINNSSGVEVLVAHAPPHQILDKAFDRLNNGPRYGNVALLNAMDYKLNVKGPEIVCCGHIHQSHGVMIKNGVLYSNAATTQQIIEI